MMTATMTMTMTVMMTLLRQMNKLQTNSSRLLCLRPHQCLLVRPEQTQSVPD
jgi:hypothetical protein